MQQTTTTPAATTTPTLLQLAQQASPYNLPAAVLQPGATFAPPPAMGANNAAVAPNGVQHKVQQACAAMAAKTATAAQGILQALHTAATPLTIAQLRQAAALATGKLANMHGTVRGQLQNRGLIWQWGNPKAPVYWLAGVPLPAGFNPNVPATPGAKTPAAPAPQQLTSATPAVPPATLAAGLMAPPAVPATPAATPAATPGAQQAPASLPPAPPKPQGKGGKGSK